MLSGLSFLFFVCFPLCHEKEARSLRGYATFPVSSRTLVGAQGLICFLALLAKCQPCRVRFMGGIRNIAFFPFTLACVLLGKKRCTVYTKHYLVGHTQPGVEKKGG